MAESVQGETRRPGGGAVAEAVGSGRRPSGGRRRRRKPNGGLWMQLGVGPTGGQWPGA